MIKEILLHTQAASTSNLDQKIHLNEKSFKFSFPYQIPQELLWSSFWKADFLCLKTYFQRILKFFYWSYEESEIISDFESWSENTISFWIFGFGVRKTKIAQNFAPQWIALPKFCRGSIFKIVESITWNWAAFVQFLFESVFTSKKMDFHFCRIVGEAKTTCDTMYQ